ncbi:MAG: glycosyltransferase family 25 protein [Sneathiellales bacterium]|nr:glycosyltransferase family 25 protein [Sneathiellales bacterium]
MSEIDLKKQLRVFVINREKDEVRREEMTKRLNDVGLEFEFFKAVDGHAIDARNCPEYDGEKRRLIFGRDLSAGEIGCLLSHRSICLKMIEETIPVAMVLEDDTHLKPELPAVLSGLLQMELKWDMIRFLSRKKVLSGTQRRVASLTPEYDLVRIQATPGGAYAYLLTLDAAKAIAAHTQRNWLPIDALQSRTWQLGLEVFMTNPSPVIVDNEVPSTIGDVRFDKKVEISGVKRILHPFFRAWFKWENGWNKRREYKRKQDFDEKLALENGLGGPQKK